MQNMYLKLDYLRQMRRMVDRGHDILVSTGSLAEFGSLLHEAWIAKRALDGCVSSPEIDTLYNRGLAAGAWGGKLLGAGGGGFLLFAVPPERRSAVTVAFTDKHEIQMHIAAPGSRIVFS